MKKIILILGLCVGVLSCEDKKENQVTYEDTTMLAQDNKTTPKEIDADLEKVRVELESFPSVKVDRVDGVITITGDVSVTQNRKIKEYLHYLKVECKNNLVVK
ncbi:MAG: hypothetical protein CSA38_00220 [Flavobacteriales bacterium]|nr:MAG: hypothetical protein CSA38_00220 [Flavobacteriales bacterium]